MLVKDMYDKLALITGFPIYTNDTDAPDINRFLLEMLSEGLQSTIDHLYISNNVLERNDTLITIPERNEYGIEGIIKNIQLIDRDTRKTYRIPYNDFVNKDMEKYEFVKDELEEDKENLVLKKGRPTSYVIKNGYLKLYPCPDKEYELKITVSTTDLVMSDDDSSKIGITHINDSVVASARFCDLVILKAAALTFARCQNPNMSVYSTLYEDRLRTFLEHDLGSLEAMRGYEHNAGHYNTSFGLIDDERRGRWYD